MNSERDQTKIGLGVLALASTAAGVALLVVALLIALS